MAFWDQSVLTDLEKQEMAELAKSGALNPEAMRRMIYLQQKSGDRQATAQQAGTLGPNPYEGENIVGVTGQAGRAGFDTRPLEYVRDPTAFMYGGRRGAFEEETARYQRMGEEAALRGQAEADRHGWAYGNAMGASEAARAQQQQGLGYLQDQIEGRGPSVAQMQQNAGLSAARDQQASIAASARGGGANLAAAQQASANAAAGLSGQAVQNAAMLRAQEQMAATNAYGQQAGAIRAGDMQRGQMSAQQQQYNQGLGAQVQGQYESARQGVYGQQLNASQAAEHQNAATMAAERGLNYQQQRDAQQRSDNQLGAALQTVGTIAGVAAMASDKNLKTNIRGAGGDIDEALGSLTPYNYDYKDSKFGEGPQTGIMAQHLLDSKAGSKAVERTEDGLMVKLPEATGLALAAVARLNERLKKVEGRRGVER